RAQEGGYTRDVALEGERSQIEMYLDMFVKGVRYARRNCNRRRVSRSLRGNVEPALDFPNIFGVLLEPYAIGRTDVFSKARQAPRYYVQHAALLPPSSRPFFRVAAVAKHAFEDHLRIELHRKRLVRCRPRDRVCV